MFDAFTGQRVQQTAGGFDPQTGQPIRPAIAPVPAQAQKTQQTIYFWDTPPEKEYDVTNCCHGCLTCGGHQKIMLFKDEIAWEETCAPSSHCRPPCVRACACPRGPVTAA